MFIYRDVATEPTQVHERIKVLPQGEKTRKTIVIDKEIGDKCHWRSS